MAVTVAVVNRSKMNSLHFVVADITLDNSYITGGEPVPPEQLGFHTIDFLSPAQTAGYTFEFDHVNKKLKAFYGTNGYTLAAHSHSENTAAAYTQNATTATAGAVSITAAPGSEVPNATNLSTVKVRCLVVGT